MSVRRTIVVGGTTILLLGSFIIHGSLTGWQLHQGALDYITGNDVKKQIILLQKQVDAQQAIIDELKGALRK